MNITNEQLKQLKEQLLQLFTPNIFNIENTYIYASLYVTHFTNLTHYRLSDVKDIINNLTKNDILNHIEYIHNYLENIECSIDNTLSFNSKNVSFDTLKIMMEFQAIYNSPFLKIEQLNY